MRLHLGPRAGRTSAFRSFQRFLAMHGDRAGLRGEGRLRDYLSITSAVKGEDVFRRREVSPLRRVHIVVDLRDGLDPRLLRAAQLIGGMFLALPANVTSLAVWGARGFFPTQSLSGTGQWPWWCKLIAHAADLDVNAKASAGVLRRAAAADEPAFLVLVSGWIEVPAIAQLSAPFGGCCFLVDPKLPPWRRPSVDVRDVSSVMSTDAAEQERDLRVDVLRVACESKRIDLYRFPSNADLFEAMEGWFR
jgi:hypothetical protein